MTRPVLEQRRDAAADTVDLKIPPKAEYISIARLTAAAFASRRSFTYDEIEDLKIAVAEACNALIGARGRLDQPIALRFSSDGGRIEVRIETRSPGVRFLTAIEECRGEQALGVFLMRCLVDEVSCTDRDGHVSLRLLTHRQEASNGGPSPAE